MKCEIKTKKFNKKWSTTLLAHFEDQQRINDRNKDGFLDNPLRNDYIFHNSDYLDYLNYSKYFEEGNARIEDVNEYNSHNTHRLSKDELYDLLLNLPYIKKELSNQL